MFLMIFAISQNLGETVVKYGCLPGGGCNYLAAGKEYPYAGFCTFKDIVHEWDCLESGSIFKVNQWQGGEIIWTGDVKVWPSTAGGRAHGHREPSAGGHFQDGDEITPWTSTSPSKQPTAAPTKQPSTSPSKQPRLGCSDLTKKWKCKQQSACKWETGACLRTDCSDITKRGKCKKQSACQWKQGVCVRVDCSAIEKARKCGRKVACKWKQGVCSLEASLLTNNVG